MVALKITANDKAMLSWANKDYKIVKQLTLNKMEENITKHETAQLGIAGVVRSCLCQSCFPDGKIGKNDLTKEVVEGNKKVVHRVRKA